MRGFVPRRFLLYYRVFAEVVALCVDSTQNYSNFVWRLYTVIHRYNLEREIEKRKSVVIV